MAECKNCFHYNACSTIFEESFGLKLPFGEHIGENSADRCKDFVSTADVVPKSEVEDLKDINEHLAVMLMEAKTDVAREIFEEIDDAKKSHALGDINDFWLYVRLTNLKKKYTGGKECTDCKHFVGCEQAVWVGRCDQYTERCVSCGEIIPEGRQVCPQCEKLH